jgi:hypothetical protein
MWRSLKELAAGALVGASSISIAATPALASKPSSHGYTHHKGAYGGGTAARYNSRLYACNGGRTYTFLGGWGCDYYLYPQYTTTRR